MRLLAIDIGGTNCRFADCIAENSQPSTSSFDIKQVFNIDTDKPDITSFRDMIDVFNTNKPESYRNFTDYDVISIAAAGPVIGKRCSPPNISWDINLDESPALEKIHLLNDFVAQAYAFTQAVELEKLICIRKSENLSMGNSAVIGAGTGLGHSLISTIDNSFHIIASEAGQSGFTFYQDEKEIEHFFQEKTGENFIYNDLVVSGSGLSLLHEFFSGETCSAKDIFAANNNKKTLDYFSRFYARACRNFCLSGCVTDKLIISGGLAAKHPDLIDNQSFLDEFHCSPTHKYLLNNISIYLNQNENIGLVGACFYAINC